MQVNHHQRLQPITRMIVKRFEGMTALKEDEIEDLRYQEARMGQQRVGGVGLVRVEGTGDKYWVFVAANSIIDQKCVRHGDELMILNRTLRETSQNMKGTLFYRCNVSLDQYGLVTCGYNLYPAYPLHQLQEEITSQVDERMKPYVLVNESKIMAEREHLKWLEEM